LEWTPSDCKFPFWLNKDLEFGLISKNTQEPNFDEEQWDTELNEYIWTYEFGDDDKPKIVVIHGYGGSGMIFFKMFRSLKSNFKVYMIDLLGMGRSSRNEFTCKNYEEWEHYFVNSIEKWRKAMKFDRINLIGHSFGGFIASKYALHYSERIEKLTLLSPWACEATSEEHKADFEKQIKEMPFYARYAYKVFRVGYEANKTPFWFGRIAGKWASCFFIRKFIELKLQKLTVEEANALYEYIHNITLSRGSSEYAFAIMFPDIAFTDKAIFNHLEDYRDLGVDVSFFYGTKDWWDTTFNSTPVSKQLMKERIKVIMIEDSGHHLYFWNPDETSAKLADHLSGNNGF
jgi:abhydrolase domain-containing protein 5